MTRTADTVTIVIHPSGTDVDNLTVADAMQQVLDYFFLLSKAELRDPSSGATLVWRLERASTNSPFTVEAAPISSHPGVSIERQAAQVITAFQEGVDDVLHARTKPAWMDGESQQAFKRILERSLNGIGRTDFISGYQKLPTTIDHRTARRAQNYLDVVSTEEALLVQDLTRKEYGSVDGHVTDATTWYDRPAFRMRVRLSGANVICVISKTLVDTIGDAHRWSEVFKKQRVLVSGLCHYNADGNLTRIDVDSITEIKGRDVSISELRDKNFNGGSTPAEHLRLIWGDQNGQSS